MEILDLNLNPTEENISRYHEINRSKNNLSNSAGNLLLTYLRFYYQFYWKRYYRCYKNYPVTSW